MGIKAKRKIQAESFLPRFAFGLSLVLFFYMTFNMFKKSAEFSETQNDINLKQEILQKERSEIEDLKSFIKFQKTDEYKELELRKREGLRMPNEIVLAEPNLLNYRNDLEIILLEKKENNEETRPIWLQWWNKFFGDE